MSELPILIGCSLVTTDFSFRGKHAIVLTRTRSSKRPFCLDFKICPPFVSFLNPSSTPNIPEVNKALPNADSIFSH